MESVIRLACIARQKDYWEIGRTMEKLGLEQVCPEDLLSMTMGDYSVTRPREEMIVIPYLTAT
jgi:hypothetical protein